MLPYYYLPIFLGLMFAAVGLTMFWSSNRQRRSKWRALLAMCFIFLGSVAAISVAIFSPSPSERRLVIERCLRTPASDISEIQLEPVPHSRTSLVSSKMSIRDKVSIARILDDLGRATPFSPNHPVEQWSAKVSLVTTGGPVSFLVEQTPSSENGALIYIRSAVTEGWTIGEFRQDHLAETLGQVVTATRVNP